MKADVKRAFVVPVAATDEAPATVHHIKAGVNVTIPDEILGHWLVKALYNAKQIIPRKPIAPAEPVAPKAPEASGIIEVPVIEPEKPVVEASVVEAPVAEPEKPVKIPPKAATEAEGPKEPEVVEVVEE